MRSELIALLCLGPAALGGVAALATDALSMKRTATALALAGLAAASGFSVWASAVHPVDSAWGVVRVGGPVSAVGAVVSVTAALALLGGWAVFGERRNGGTFAALVALSAVASVVVATSRDVTLLLIALETAAVCAYALVLGSGTKRSSEAAMKYFIQSALATGFLLVAIAVLVSVFIPQGDLNGLVNAFSRNGLFSVAMTGIVLLLSVLAFKAGAAPFHSWAPDVYETASPEVTAFLASGPKVAAITAATIILELVASDTSASTSSVRAMTAVALVISVIAVASVLIGSLVALRQRSYTRMLAYAGIAQAGYALIGASTLNNPAAAVFFVSIYALATVGTFLAATAFHRIDPSWDGSVSGLAGMGRTAPVLSASLTVLLLSLAGIPPLLGFWGKFVVFGGALLQASSAFAAGLTAVGWISAIAAGVGILGSIVSLGYYGAVLRALYLVPAAAPASGVELDSLSAAGESARGVGMIVTVVVLLAVAVVVLGLVPMVWGLAPIVSPFVAR